MQLKGEYKGYTVEWAYWAEKWNVVKWDVATNGMVTIGTYDTPTKAREAIDRFIKKKYKRVPVIVYSRWDKSAHGVATGLVGQDRVRVTFKDTSRTTEKISDVFLDTPETLEKFEKIGRLNEEISLIESHVQSILMVLPRLSPADMEVPDGE